MKVANLRLLQQVVPVVTTVRTWNADSNHPMLASNRALGFAVTGWTREWGRASGFRRRSTSPTRHP